MRRLAPLPARLPEPPPYPCVCPCVCPPYRELSREPHLASSPRDEALVRLLLQRWQDPESGLDAAEAPAYEVLLSFPSPEQPNRVAVGEVPLRPGDTCAGGVGGAARPSPDASSCPQ